MGYECQAASSRSLATPMTAALTLPTFGAGRGAGWSPAASLVDRLVPCGATLIASVKTAAKSHGRGVTKCRSRDSRRAPHGEILGRGLTPRSNDGSAGRMASDEVSGRAGKAALKAFPIFFTGVGAVSINMERLEETRGPTCGPDRFESFRDGDLGVALTKNKLMPWGH